MKITSADAQLLSALRENARASTAEIARRLGLSRTTVQSRMERLEREGVIRGYTVRVNEQVERGYIRAHILIPVAPKQMPAVVQALHEMPQVRSLHSVSGAHDLVAMGVVPTVVDMDELTDRIGALDGVTEATVGDGALGILVRDAPRHLSAILTSVEDVRSVEIERPDLEAVFLHLTGKALRD